MTVFWTDKQSINQTLSGSTTWEITLHQTPVSGIPVASGLSAFAFVLTSVPSGVCNIANVEVAWTDQLGTQLVASPISGTFTDSNIGADVLIFAFTSIQNFWGSTGGFLKLFSTGASTASFNLVGISIALLDNTTWPGGFSEHSFSEGSLPINVSNISGSMTNDFSIGNTSGNQLDAWYGAAAQITDPPYSSSPIPFSFAADPNWIDLLSDSFSNTPCLTGGNNPIITTSPQTISLIPNGSMPIGATSLATGMSIIASGAFTNSPTYSLQAQILDSTSTPLALSPTLTLVQSGVATFTWTVNPLPAGAAILAMVFSWNFGPTGLGIQIQAGSGTQGFEVLCNNIPIQDYEVTIGQYVGSLPIIPGAVTPWAFSNSISTQQPSPLLNFEGILELDQYGSPFVTGSNYVTMFGDILREQREILKKHKV